jgi:hypothetical protein
MRRVKGARHAHAVMRAQGRTPGDEGRAVIARNREARKHCQVGAYPSVISDEL